MSVRVHHLGLAFLVMLAVAVLLPRAALAASEFSLIDQGWQIVEQDGKRTIEVSAMVINESQASLEYEVRFIVERAESMPEVAESAEAAEPAEPVWSVVRTASVHGGPLAPSGSDTVTGTFPHEVLVPGKAHRFRSELSEAEGSADAPTGPVMADAVLTSLGSPFAPTATLGGFRLPPLSLPPTDETRLPHLSPRDAIAGPGLSAASTIGFGTLNGQHWSHRQGGYWHEVGAGSIYMKDRGWAMSLEYAYYATGLDAEDLSADFIPTLTGGTYWSPGEGKYDIRFLAAEAQMLKAGLRHDVGSVRYSQGARAAGSFTARLVKQAGTGDGPGEVVWTGTLSLFNGYMSLNLSGEEAPYITDLLPYLPTGVGYRGRHEFKLKFTATQVSSSP